MTDPEAPARRPRTPRNTKVFTLRIPVRDYEQATAVAQQHHITIAELFRTAFRIATKRQDKL